MSCLQNPCPILYVHPLHSSSTVRPTKRSRDRDHPGNPVRKKGGRGRRQTQTLGSGVGTTDGRTGHVDVGRRGGSGKEGLRETL